MSAPQRWLPVGITLGARESLVRWIDFGETPIEEPFFADTVDKLLSQSWVRERRTRLRGVIEAAGPLPQAQPAGIILHISRCGSTLLSNVLRLGENTTVLSESAQIGVLLEPSIAESLSVSEGPTFHRELLDSILRLYAARPDGSTSQIVLKCHALNILNAAFIRSLWPSVPIVIMIRNPVEVIVSNLRSPSPWINAISQPSLARSCLGVCDGKTISREEVCARGLGAFCRCGLQIAGMGSRVVDYELLGCDLMEALGAYFSIALPGSTDALMQDTLGRYSKDVTRRRKFSDDKQPKHAVTTPAVREAAERWALAAYNDLRPLSLGFHTDSAD